MGLYFHPVFGPHEGVPIGGEESSAISQEQFATLSGQWHSSSLSLEDAKISKLLAVNTNKNESLDGGFEYNGMLFDSDSKARLAYLEFAFKLSQDPSYSTPWKASTGQWVIMDAVMFTSLQPAYEAHIQGCFIWQAGKEIKVAAAKTTAEVEAISERRE